MKKLMGLIACFMIMLTLTACGEAAEPLLDENGNWVHYSEENIVTDNYYILKDDGFYYRILNVPTGESSLGTIFAWFCEPYDAAIPHFTNKDRLMFYSDTARPSSLTLYKMTDYAYTLGAMFQTTTDTGDLKHPQVIQFTDTYNVQSPVQSVVEGALTPNATTYITGINNHEFTANLLVDDSFLKGLTKDTMYQLEVYCGTVRKTINIKADTHLFLKEATYMTSSYEELKSKVFEIYLPQNLAPGYYYAEGVGMFYYEGTLDDLDEDDIENMLENESSESSEEELEEYGDSDDAVATPLNDLGAGQEDQAQTEGLEDLGGNAGTEDSLDNLGEGEQSEKPTEDTGESLESTEQVE